MSDSHLLSKNNITPADYQKPLVSGTDIKTVNSNSLLGSGNISLQEPITGAASSILSSNLTESRAVISNANGKLDVSSVTSTELGYMSGVTSSIQTQMDNRITLDTVQTITGIKTFSSGTLQANTPTLLKQNNANEGGHINFQRSNNSVLASDPYIDLNTNTIRVIGTSSKNATNITLQVDVENNKVLVPTPLATSNDNQVATTAWCNAYIGKGGVDYSSGTDVTSSVFVASGTGYKPTKNGVLMIKTLNSGGGTCDIFIYNSSGTLKVQKQFNTAGSAYTLSGGTCEMLLDSNHSVRVSTQYGTSGTQFWAIFFPYA